MLLISRTPLRVSLFGGGTDYPEYFRERPGATLGFAIDKYIYISALPLRAMVQYRYRVGYSRVETCEKVREIQHPVVREVMREEDYLVPTDFSVQADLPAGAGLGSSSTFTVGFQHLIWALQNKPCDPMALAKQAIHVERELLKEQVGVQDQLHASFGGLRRYDFHGDQISEHKIQISDQGINGLHQWMFLIFTGQTRHASQVLDEQIKRTTARKLDVNLSHMHEMVDEAQRILEGKDEAAIPTALAPLLAESWQLKKDFSSTITNHEIDELYEFCLREGALGGKLCGAGAGGFLLVIVPPERRKALMEKVGPRNCVEFFIDETGSTILGRES